MNSWGKSACYPRSTFCPLSDGPSTRHRQITRTRFRACPACLPRSQAPLCPCTRALIPNQGEGTFARLRYSLGGDRPSQTARLALSARRLTARVRNPVRQGWYFTAGSAQADARASQPPSYPTHGGQGPSAKLR